VEDTTTELYIEPNALVIGLADDLMALCHEYLPPSGLKVYRVAHAHAAAERIAVLLPRLVVVSAVMSADELDMVLDRAKAVAAVVLLLDPEEAYEVLGKRLSLTLDELRVRYGGR
jgi:hypothetical protein